MSQLRVRRTALSLVALVVGLSGVFIAYRHAGAWVEVRQPVPFNHLAHKKGKVQCNTCHTLFETSAAAGRPTMEIYMTCHNEEEKNPKILEVKNKGLRKEEYEWKRIYRAPAHVYFSHQRHVVLGKLACDTCHGDAGERTTPQPRPAVRIEMNRCMDCHRQKNASTDCNACHR